jgi:hypothetical protein
MHKAMLGTALGFAAAHGRELLTSSKVRYI